eukprot:TRINITY_DN26095_c0_g1_i1.p1 TRINITY_DN26095_c0_g1~~TRINITY_DN26095_c0_g1_i1.p1  ORF type:complete len:343 (-),score=64.48 TRINITY_DN26095_c0_g1_i1:203-1108(-)
MAAVKAVAPPIFHATLDAMAQALTSVDETLGASKWLSEFSPVERLLRMELAAAYRWVYKQGWSDTINNHISAKIPGTEHFLLNPYGLGYDEVTASSLVKVDLQGNVVHPGHATIEYVRGHVNKAGFIIHSCIHSCRPDLQCVLHTHAPDVVAVSATRQGLLPVGQAFAVVGAVAYHDYEGVAVSPSERETLARDFGPNSKVMLLRNHGCLVGGRSVAECIILAYYLHVACEMQVKAAACTAAAGGAVVLPSQDVVDLARQQTEAFETSNGEGQASRASEVKGLQWIYHLRSLVKADSSFLR